MTNIPQRQPSLVSVKTPQLGPIKGPLHLYGQKALGDTSPEGKPTLQKLPAVLLPKQLPPVGHIPPLRRSLSGLAPPILPPIPTLKPSPITSSDENIHSTSETDGGGTTSEGGGANRLETHLSRRPLLPQQSLPTVTRSPPRQSTITSLPPLPPMGMPSRRTSVNPFTSPQPLVGRTTPSFPLERPLSQSNLPEVRPPILPSIPQLVREEDPAAIITEAEVHTIEKK